MVRACGEAGVIKLNVGCGPYQHTGWINVDTAESNRPDVVANLVDGLPFRSGSASHIYAGHVLEHIPADYGVETALREIKRLLCFAGTLVVVGPALDLALRFDADPATVESIVHQNPPGPYDPLYHQWLPTSYNTLDLVREVFPHAELLTNPRDVRFEIFDAVGSRRAVDSSVLARLQEERWPLTSITYWQCAISVTRED